MTGVRPADVTSIEKLADWSLTADARLRSDRALRQASLLVLDTIGCALAALDNPDARAVRELAQETGGQAECTIIGSEAKSSLLNAVLVNGVLVRVLDFNDIMFVISDGHMIVGGHRSDNIPVALAVGEKLGSSGADVLQSIVLGYELFGRLKALTHYGNPFDSSTLSGFVSVAMAGRLMKFDAGRQAQALAIAGARCLTPFLVRKGHVSAMKSCANALVAQAGVQGALLAAKGVTGPLELLDHKTFGLQHFFDPAQGFEKLWAPLPLTDHLEIFDTNIKSYPCIGTGQTLVKAAIDAHARVQGRLTEIEQIEIVMPDAPFIKDQHVDPARLRPLSREAADHSFPFLAVAALMDGELGERQFADHRWADAETCRLMAKVKLTVSRELREQAPDSVPCRIVVRLKGGETIASECLYPPGHSAAGGLDEGVVIEKFVALAEPVLGAGQTKEVTSRVLGMSTSSSVADIMDLLRPSKA